MRMWVQIGTASFAASACITAGTCTEMDLFGTILVGSITAVGGGTIRDILIGNAPVFWMVESEYLLIAFAAAGLAFFFAADVGLGPSPTKDTETAATLLEATDALGIGAFGVIGCQNALRKRLGGLVCVACGIMTATFGGVVRDVLTKRDVRILHSHATLYACCAGSAAGVYYGCAAVLNCSPAVRVAAGLATGIGSRVLSESYGLRLPTMQQQFKRKEETLG